MVQKWQWIISTAGQLRIILLYAWLYRMTQLLADWVGLILIWDVPRLVGRYSSYLLPNQAGGTPQIKFNPTEARHEMCHPIYHSELT